MHLVPKARRIAAPLALVLALFALAAGSAHASLLVADGANCNDYSSSQVFLPWADPANYTLAPGGDFEKGSSRWNLVGASRVGNDNESFQVGGSADRASLSLPSGSVAISPAMCVGLSHPDFRVFFKQTDGSAVAALRIDVLFDDATGTTQTQNVGGVGGRSSWTLSAQIPIVVNLLPLLDQGTPVAFRFTALGGDFRIDDLYVDPWTRG
ncbi:MAG: hypothetical protein QOH62_3480 [Solirubrobacteraceae bacterium]|nr:hypothetical protein [Solirubrobacteraceae bacterium]